MGRSPACSSNYTAEKDGAAAGSLKKGAWTPEEDQKLVSFIEKNKGHGSWRTLPHLAGLQRCGKSCRLRWTNYLRPNIKRGNFSVEEERTITQLHALLGNKWSSIASHLPGRTDNEVKNHWNTHMKKRLTRMGIDPATHRPSAAVDHSNLMQALMNIRPNYNIQLQPLLVNGDSSLTLNAAPPRCTTVIPDPADIISTNSHAHPHAALRRPAAGPKPATSVACPNFSITPLPVDTSFVTHMAQWELARLEAEARLAATSTSSSASARRPRSTELSHLMKSSGRSSCASGTNFPSWRNFGSSGALAPNDKSEKSSSSSSSAIACKRYMVKPPPPDNQIILQALTEMLSVSVLSMPGNDSTEESASILSLPSLGASSTSCASASSKSKQSTNGAADDDHNSTDNDNIALQNMMSSGVNITDPAAGSGGAAIKDVVLERSSWSSSIRSGCTADDAENSTPNNLQRSGCKTITSDSLQNLMMLDVDDDQPLDVDLMIISPEPATSCHHISMDQMVIRAQAPAVPLFDLMNVNNIDPAGASPDQPCESSGSPAAYWAHLLNGLVLGPSSSTLSSCS